MFHVTTATRIAFGLTFISMSVLLGANALDLIPNPTRIRLEGRTDLCDAIAVQLSIAAQNNQLATMEDTIQSIVERNHELLSACIRDAKKTPHFQTKEHEANWASAPKDISTPAHVRIQIYNGTHEWGTIELAFKPLIHTGFLHAFKLPGIRLAIFVSLTSLLAYMIFLRRVLYYLDPSSVIPDRVKAVLDTMAEGVLVLDNQQRIVLANEAFQNVTGKTIAQLQGQNASDFQWTDTKTDEKKTDHPWNKSMLEGIVQKRIPLALEDNQGIKRTFSVNSTPIMGGNGECRGVMATFDDATEIENKNTQLEKMLANLKTSRNKLNRKNKELKILATNDPLTSCLNRLAFFEQFDKQWAHAKLNQTPVSCIMLDIDFFKAINDNHGHTAGDDVLQGVASTLKKLSRPNDTICRYGGEEFCILLPETTIQEGAVVAETFRQTIEDSYYEGINVTISLGLSDLSFEASSIKKLIDQADQALYAAKESGRNKVVRYDLILEISEAQNTQPDHDMPFDETESPISYGAISALMSTLDYRDPETAAHSRRVSKLCVVAAEGIMSKRDCFVLEMAGALHDIGKIGIPDSILLKPSALSDEEWLIMEQHQRMGVEIINAAFHSPELINIVGNHQAFFGGRPSNPGLPKGNDIPLGARILSIADAYDAIVSDRVYRKGRTQSEAFKELQRCAGTQFDPDLVERFIECIKAQDEHSPPALSQVQENTLRIGLEIERLADALNAQDMKMLAAMSNRLSLMATQFDLPEIATLASQIYDECDSDYDLEKVLLKTRELLELCNAASEHTMTPPTQNLSHL